MSTQGFSKLVLDYVYQFTIPDPDEEEKVNFLNIKISQAQEARGVRIKCDVVKGTGIFSLKKNGRSVGNAYLLSAEAGYPRSVEFRTLTSDEMDQYKKDLPINDWELNVEAQEATVLKFSAMLINPY